MIIQPDTVHRAFLKVRDGQSNIASLDVMRNLVEKSAVTEFFTGKEAELISQVNGENASPF